MWFLGGFSQVCEGWGSVYGCSRDTTQDPLDDWAREPMKAAGAWREACRIESPPRELGREAFSQAQSDRGAPSKSDSASRIHVALSKAAVASSMWLE